MANEISFTASLTCYKPSVMAQAIGRSVVGLQITMAGTTFVEGGILVSTAGIAVDLGQVTAPHWAWFNNLDPANYFTLYNGVSGAVLCRFLAGEQAWIPLDPTCVPYAKANTASVQVEYLIFSA